MEWSLHVARASDVKKEFSPEELPVEPAARLLRQYWRKIPISRIAAGTEFCENLIGSEDSAQRIVDASANLGVPFTYLTPYLSDRGMERILPTLDYLNRWAPNAEVVFNDWGTLNIMLRDFPKLKPVQGRLLNKSLRDPRITGLFPETTESGAGLIAIQNLRKTNLDGSLYVDMLTRLGVDQVEVDNLPQGLDFDHLDQRLKVSVYLPFGFVATSRSCMAAGLGYAPADKFMPGAPCHHECQTHRVVFTYSNSPFANRDQQFLLKGNTYFFHHSEPMLKRLIQNVFEGKVHRLVLQQNLPMYA